MLIYGKVLCFDILACFILNGFLLLTICSTEIDWHQGKCLTQKILKKKPKKGSKNAKPIIKTEQCESFFNFFSPPQVPDDEEDIDEEAVSISFSSRVNFSRGYDEDAVSVCFVSRLNLNDIFSLLLGQAEELQSLMEQDYDIGYVDMKISIRMTMIITSI